eukprot:Ihof_evm1s459 gene=Ihof_evmTU1s459
MACYDFPCIAQSQIRHIVSELDGYNNTDSARKEIYTLINQYGPETYTYYLHCLLALATNLSRIGQESSLWGLVRLELISLVERPNYTSILCAALQTFVDPTEGPQLVIGSNTVQSIAQGAGLDAPHAFVYTAALTCSPIEDVKDQANRILQLLAPELLARRELTSKTISPATLVNLLHGLRDIADLSRLETQYTNFLQQLRKSWPQEDTQGPLIPLLYGDEHDLCIAMMEDKEETDMMLLGTSNVDLAGMMEELGYSCIATKEEAIELLTQFRPDQLVAECMARVLGLFARTYQGLEETHSLHTSLAHTGPQWIMQQAEKKSEDTKPDKWIYQNFVDAFKAMNANVSWHEVIERLDYPSFNIPDVNGFRVLCDTYQMAALEPFPIHLCLKRWKNTKGQLSLLQWAIKIGQSFFINSQSHLNFISPENLMSSMEDPSNKLWGCLELIECLLSLAETDLYESVSKIFSHPMRQCPDILIFAVAQAESTHCEWTTLRTELSSRIMPVILQNFPSTSKLVTRLWTTRKDMVLKALAEWYQSKDGKVPFIIARIVQMAAHLNALSEILSAMPAPPQVLIDTALKAHPLMGNELGPFLTRMVDGHRQSIMVLAYCLASRLQQANTSPNEVPPMEVVYTVLNVLNAVAGTLPQSQQDELKTLRVLSGQIYPPLKLRLEQETKPTLPPSSSQSPLPLPNTSTTFSPDVEFDAKSYFVKMYSNKMSVNDMLALMKRLKASAIPKDQQTFNCMVVQNLFDEYRFFHNKYPDNQLNIAALLFGSLIQQDLVQLESLVTALRCVLEALKNPPNTRMFRFGRISLEQFKGRLQEWPQYVQVLTDIPHLKAIPELVSLVEQVQGKIDSSGLDDSTKSPILVAAMQNLALSDKDSQAVPTSQPSFGPKSPAVSSVSTFGTVNNIQTLLAIRPPADILFPNENAQDKVGFLFNNLSETNVDDKGQELKSFLPELYNPWLAWYIVVKRASLEANFHGLYIQFLDAVKMPKLTAIVVEKTYHYIKLLLDSPKMMTSSSERSLLKNLGSFLGQLTLARNKPILMKDLALKELILDGYKRSRLIYVIPFVAKVMESCSKSRVFKLPNPWVTSILRILKEMHLLSDLKLNLKFEIEVLCKNINVDLNDLEPTTTLKDIQTEPDSTPPQPQITPPMLTGAPPLAMIKDEPERTTTPTPLVPIINTPQLPSQPQSLGPSGMTLPSANQLPSLVMNNNISGVVTSNGSMNTVPMASPGIQSKTSISHNGPMGVVYLNMNCQLFQQIPQLAKRCVQMAVDNAIREMTPVLERSVHYCCQATRELILKDFALESDEGKMRRAGQMMAQSLAVNLALVTCKDPLRISLTNHLRSSLQQTVPPSSNSLEQQSALLEQAVQFALADNLETALQHIHMIACDKAANQIEDALGHACEARRKSRVLSGQPFYDVTQFTGRYPTLLPEPLRPRPPTLMPPQFRVYEDFNKYLNNFAANAQRSGNTPPTTTTSQDQDEPMISKDEGIMLPPPPPHQSSTSTGDPRGMNNTNASLDKLALLMVEVYKVVALHANLSLASVPSTSNLHAFLRQIPFIIIQSANRSEVILSFGRKAMQSLYENVSDTSKLSREVLIVVLQSIYDMSKQVTLDLTGFYLHHIDSDTRYSPNNIDVTLMLLRCRLLSANEVDADLAKLIETRSPASIEAACRMLIGCNIDAPLPGSYVVMPRPSLPQSREALQSLDQTLAAHLPEQVRNAITKATEESAPVDKALEELLEGLPANGQERILQLFDQCVRLSYYQQPIGTDVQMMHFIQELKQQGVIVVERLTDAFLRLCIDSAVSAAYITPVPVTVDQSNGAKPLNFQAIDALSKLIVIIIKMGFGNGDAATVQQKQMQLLQKVMQTVVTAIITTYKNNPQSHYQRAYYRLLLNLLQELTAPDSILDPLNQQILPTLNHALHLLQPCRVPQMAFSWLELISHRSFMPKLLISKAPKGWPLFQKLLVDLFKFMEPYLRGAEMNEPIRMLYKGMLRVLLVLLHDFPEILCDFHFSFCDVIPPTCIQLRNIILSAFPKNMRLPDPFTPNLKVDLLPEINQSPRILSNYVTALHNGNFRQDIDNYLKNREVPFLMSLASRLLLPNQNEVISAGTRYNTPVINALVLYVGHKAIEQIQSNAQGPLTHSAPMDIFQHLVVDLDTEGRYLFLNAIANQLRYPNSHTHYFSCVLLYLFAEANQEMIQEQITRVLVERLIVNRPYPWGLLITFIELIK